MPLEQWIAEVARRIKISEGCKLVAYPDPLSGGDPWTVGFGSTGSDIQMGTTWTQAQADAALLAAIPKYVSQARASLQPGIFDVLSDARRFCIVDFCYNMGDGSDGWGGFTGTHGLIAQAQLLKNQGKLVQAHTFFIEAGQHLKASAWASQVGARASRDIAMLVSGSWLDPNGDGSDGAV